MDPARSSVWWMKPRLHKDVVMEFTHGDVDVDSRRVALVKASTGHGATAIGIGIGIGVTSSDQCAAA
jgi:hypothetical protein